MTPRQEAICSIFAEVFGTSGIGPDDDFFELGGRSVDAVLLAGRINAAYGSKLTIADVFDAPSAAQLDKRLDAIGPREI